MRNTDAYINFLLLVLLADNKIKKEETDFLEEVYELFEYEELNRTRIKNILERKEELNKEEIIKHILQNFALNIIVPLIRDAYIMAYIDGILSPEELELINFLLKEKGYSEEACKTIQAWGEEQVKQLERAKEIFAMSY